MVRKRSTEGDDKGGDWEMEWWQNIKREGGDAQCGQSEYLISVDLSFFVEAGAGEDLSYTHFVQGHSYLWLRRGIIPILSSGIRGIRRSFSRVSSQNGWILEPSPSPEQTEAARWVIEDRTDATKSSAPVIEVR